jgi:dTDP-4-dehydrorhamnose reductase
LCIICSILFWINPIKKNIYHKETSKIFTFNHYCKQKILSEKICKKNKSLIFRTNFFGKSTNKKSNHNKPTFTDWIYNKFTAPDDKFYLFKDIYFNPIYVGTLSNIVCKIIDDTMHDYRGIFNIGSKFGMNKKNFACHFAKAVGIYSSKCYRSVASDHIFKTKRTKYMMMNSKKFKNTFKIKLNSLKDEIKKAAKYYKKN